jgi:hypothetical protein
LAARLAANFGKTRFYDASRDEQTTPPNWTCSVASGIGFARSGEKRAHECKRTKQGKRARGLSENSERMPGKRIEAPSPTTGVFSAWERRFK